MLRHTRWPVTSLLLLGACARGSAPQALTPDVQPEARAALILVDSALTVMRSHALNAAQVDWPVVRETARARVLRGDLPPMTAARLAIRYSLAALNDHHSFMMFPGDDPRWSRPGAPATEPEVRFVPPQFGYATVPSFGVGDGDGGAVFAARLQARLAIVASQGACGWVIDLRGNTGGNMWPLLLALGPILGDGLAGSFVGTDTIMRWGYSAGSVWYGTDTLGRVASTPASLGAPAVAVLTSPRTASSGEALAIAFRGRPRTRSFGQPTGGLATANEGFPLPDGSKLVLTTSSDADRTGRRYGAAVEPDELVPDSLALDRSLEWLGTQPCDGTP